MDVACLVVPDFPVALARRDNPKLRGRPVVIGGSPEEHAQVRACSREAAAAGVTVGTTLRRALTLCPKAAFLPYHEVAVAEEAARLAALLHDHSPLVEEIGPGHVHFEVRGLARLAGMADEGWLRDLHAAAVSVSGLPVQLAAADTVFAAHAAAVAMDGGGEARLILPGGAKEFLAVLPIEVLPVAPAMHERLRLFGLEWLGQLAEIPFSALQAQFGREGARAWELANGRDDACIVSKREEVRIDEEMELPAPTSMLEPLVIGTRALLTRALNRPEVRGHSLRRLDWRVALESGELVTRRLVFREPSSDPAYMLFVAKARIERLQLPAAALSLGLTLSGLCSEYGHQAHMWQQGPRRQKELLEAVEQLEAREGEPLVYRIVEVEPWSRIPERQLALVAYGL
jgi:protein ImuB